MQLQEIIKYKSKNGKPYRVESVTVALRSVRLAKHTADAYPISVGTSLLMYSMGCIFMTDRKKLEALTKSINGIVERFHEKF